MGRGNRIQISRHTSCTGRTNMCYLMVLVGFVLLQSVLAMSVITVDVIGSVNETIVLKYRHTGQLSLHIQYLPPNYTAFDNNDKDITRDGGLEPEFKNKGFGIHVNESLEEVNLFIRAVAGNMAGVYQSLAGGHPVEAYRVIVLGSMPICHLTRESVNRNVQHPDKLRHHECSALASCKSSPEDSVRTSTDFIGPNYCSLPQDRFRLSCDVTFSGSTIPDFKLINLKDNEVVEPSCSPGDVEGNAGIRRLTCEVTMNAALGLDGVQFRWTTNQSGYKQYSYTTEPIKILYALDGHPSNLKTAALGDRINCSANCSNPCGFKWTWSDKPGHGGEHYISCERELVINRPGFYSCEVLCPIGLHLCEVNAMQIAVPTKSGQVGHEKETVDSKTIGLVVMGVTVVLMGIAVVLVVLYAVSKLRRRGRNSPLDETNETQLAETRSTVEESERLNVRPTQSNCAQDV